MRFCHSQLSQTPASSNQKDKAANIKKLDFFHNTNAAQAESESEPKRKRQKIEHVERAVEEKDEQDNDVSEDEDTDDSDSSVAASTPRQSELLICNFFLLVPKYAKLIHVDVSPFPAVVSLFKDSGKEEVEVEDPSVTEEKRKQLELQAVRQQCARFSLLLSPVLHRLPPCRFFLSLAFSF